jgi:hypothetical protein
MLWSAKGFSRPLALHLNHVFLPYPQIVFVVIDTIGGVIAVVVDLLLDVDVSAGRADRVIDFIQIVKNSNAIEYESLLSVALSGGIECDIELQMMPFARRDSCSVAWEAGKRPGIGSGIPQIPKICVGALQSTRN